MPIFSSPSVGARYRVARSRVIAVFLVFLGVMSLMLALVLVARPLKAGVRVPALNSVTGRIVRDQTVGRADCGTALGNYLASQPKVPTYTSPLGGVDIASFNRELRANVQAACRDAARRAAVEASLLALLGAAVLTVSIRRLPPAQGRESATHERAVPSGSSEKASKLSP